MDMTEEDFIEQTGPLSFRTNASLLGAANLVRSALSKVAVAKILKDDASGIEGECSLVDRETPIAFAVRFRHTWVSTTIELEFRDEDPIPLRNVARNIIGKAIYSEYEPETKPRSNWTPLVSADSDYKATSRLGFVIAAVGWAGVVLSVGGGLILGIFRGPFGLAAGFVSAFFCLLTVATGQLLRAQIEVANNTRLILENLRIPSLPGDS